MFNFEDINSIRSEDKKLTQEEVLILKKAQSATEEELEEIVQNLIKDKNFRLAAEIVVLTNKI